jgi:hypothetical protein
MIYVLEYFTRKKILRKERNVFRSA